MEKQKGSKSSYQSTDNRVRYKVVPWGDRTQPLCSGRPGPERPGAAGGIWWGNRPGLRWCPNCSAPAAPSCPSSSPTSPSSAALPAEGRERVDIFFSVSGMTRSCSKRLDAATFSSFCSTMSDRFPSLSSLNDGLRSRCCWARGDGRWWGWA